MQTFTEEEVNAAKKIFKYWRESSEPNDSFQYFLDQIIQIGYPAEEPAKPTYTENLDKYVDLTNRLFQLMERKIDGLLKIQVGEKPKTPPVSPGEILNAYETFSRIYLQSLVLQKKREDEK